MKSAYELAMERLNRTAPTKKLSDEQKKQIAELERFFKAKLAERELYFQGEIAKMAGSDQLQQIEELQKRLAVERRQLQDELEQKKGQVRQAAG